MRMSFNKSEGNSELLVADWYNFTIIEAYEKNKDGAELITRTGTAYHKLVCQEHKSKTALYHILFLDPLKPVKVMHFLNATGFSYESGEEVDISANMWIGKRFQGKVEVEEGRNKIRFVKQIPLSGPDPSIPEGFSEEDPPDAEPTRDPELDEDVPF